MKLLIVGGGITGTVLALRLLERNAQLTLLDNGRNECSAVAAGILNPLVFRRMHLSWRVDDFFEEAKLFYTNYCAESWHDLEIRRLFASEQERQFWLEKQHLPVFSNYMKTVDEADNSYASTGNTYGTGLVKKAGWVDTAIFLERAKEIIRRQHGETVEAEFDYTALNPQTAEYQGEGYDFIVFAEGKGMRKNPWFNYLPLVPTKGELLTIESDSIPENEELNRKCFVLPVGNKRFRIGSTYEFNTDDTIVTEINALKIRENLKSVTNEPYTVLAQQAGVRPTVPDRRPLLGKHPDYPKLAVANGMGTKGFMIAPRLMNEFVDFLLCGNALDSECLTDRFPLKRL